MLNATLRTSAGTARFTGLFLLLVAPRAGLSDGNTLPDKWFFPDRPDALKELEGQPSPNLNVGSWIGDSVELEESKGKVVIIDFWATWCEPCMKAIPKNVEIVDKFKDKGLVFIGVHDVNAGWDKAAGVVTDKKINYPVALDEAGGESAKAFNLAFWPTYVILDRSGIVRGAGLDPQYLEDAIRELLAESPPDADSKKANGLPAEWFFAGKRRPALKTLEGQPMPPLDAGEWLEAPLTAEDARDRVVILHFFAAGNGPSMKQAESLARLEREMGPHGVVVVGISAANDDTEPLRKAIASRQLPTRLYRDAGIDGDVLVLGASAAAFGVRFMPCTIIVDRAGMVRASGVQVNRVAEIAGALLAENTESRDGTGGSESVK